MSTLELQNQLIRKILEIKDQEVLEYLFTIAGHEQGAPYKLNSSEQRFIRESLDEYEAGQVISNDEVIAKTDQWSGE